MFAFWLQATSLFWCLRWLWICYNTTREIHYGTLETKWLWDYECEEHIQYHESILKPFQNLFQRSISNMLHKVSCSIIANVESTPKSNVFSQGAIGEDNVKKCQWPLFYWYCCYQSWNFKILIFRLSEPANIEGDQHFQNSYQIAERTKSRFVSIMSLRMTTPLLVLWLDITNSQMDWRHGTCLQMTIWARLFLWSRTCVMRS